MVCLVFGEIVSQFPISGGLYPWARPPVWQALGLDGRLVYGWALFVTLAAIATGAAPFLAELLGVEGTPAVTTTIALAADRPDDGLESERHAPARAGRDVRVRLRADRRHRRRQLLADLRRHQPWSALVDTRAISSGGSYWPAFLTSSLAAMFCYYGFEAVGTSPRKRRTLDARFQRRCA